MGKNKIGLERLSCCCVKWKKDKSVYMIGSCFCRETLQNWSIHTLLLGKKNWSSSVEDNLSVPQTIVHQTILLLGKYPRELKKIICIQKLTNECSEQPFSSHPKSGNNPNVIQLTTGWNVTYPYNGIVFIHNEAWSTDTCCNMDEPCKYCAEWKYPDTKRITYYMTQLTWNFYNRQTIETESRPVVAKRWRELGSKIDC